MRIAPEDERQGLESPPNRKEKYGARLAVVLVEFQKQWTEPGLFHLLIRREMQRNQVMANATQLAKTARALQVPVIHAPLVVDPKAKRGLYAHITRGLFFRKDSHRAEIDERVFHEQDRVVKGRSGFDAFKGSDLEQVLRELHITTVLLAGFATDQCVGKTLRSALRKGFSAYMITDCSATFCRALQRRAERLAKGHTLSHEALTDSTCIIHETSSQESQAPVRSAR